jgi:hypothetical protein
MRGKRTPEETKAKVVELKMWNLDLSSYDIAESLKWTDYPVSADTVQDIINELPQVTSTEKWKKQLERLDAIISGIEDITHDTIQRVKGSQELTIKDVKDLNDIAKSNWDRKRLLEGNSTENNKVTIEWTV